MRLRNARKLDPKPGVSVNSCTEQPARFNACIGALYRRMDRRRYRIIGVGGGVFSAEDAYEKIHLGTSLVQLMTGLIYEGPGLVRRINEGLCRLLERDGLAHIAEAVGRAHDGGDPR